MMRVVLLSGGSGKRLWPLSNEIRSKAFLRLLRKEDGGRESMIQRVCRQLEQAGLLASTCIVTHESQAEITQSHIGEGIPLICEPRKRGTFTAIALAGAFMHSRLQASPDETVCVLPVDAFVQPAFYEAILRFPSVLARSGASLGLIGTPPDTPSGQFGYMVPKERSPAGYVEIARFVEKPSEEEAAAFIRQGALWNCGVFAFPLGFLLKEMTGRGLPLDDRELRSRYGRLPERSFDQEVVEKTSPVMALSYPGPWEDLGSWTAFAGHLEGPVTGLGHVGEDSPNTHLVNELACPVHVIDVPDIIVAASPDGILVASKRRSNLIKDRLKDSQAVPLHEEKRWGERRILEYSMDASGEAITSKLTVQPGKSLSYHVHHKRREMLVILSGTGEFILDGRVFPVHPGDTISVPAGARHGMRADHLLTVMEIHMGAGLAVEDTDRLALAWEDALRYETAKGSTPGETSS